MKFEEEKQMQKKEEAEREPRMKKLDNGNYAVTDDGNVYSFNVGRYLKPCRSEYGYKKIDLSKDNKRTKKGVHGLVADAFIKKPETIEKLEVHHRDLNKANNNVSNLQWRTEKEHDAIHRLIAIIQEAKQILKILDADAIDDVFNYVNQ